MYKTPSRACTARASRGAAYIIQQQQTTAGVGRAGDNRGDSRRATETENGRDSDVADNEPRHTTEAMHHKEGPNIKLTNTKRPRCTDRKKKTFENYQRSQPTEGVQNNNIDTDTERSIKQNEKESENRQREQPLWRQGASGRHV